MNGGTGGALRRASSGRLHRPGVDPRPIRLEECAAGARTDLRVALFQDALGSPIEVPFVVLRGRHPGPVVGISAAVHGNELNGIKIIHNLLNNLDPEEMRGSLLCAPVVNVPGFRVGRREFPMDGVDLNHVFPGKADGTPSEQYARAFLITFLTGCNYLIDVHTASEGRINSMYVRADLTSELAREFALLMGPEIVLHVRGGDGSLRNAARVRGIPAITVEAGNPSVFQGRMVLEAELGIRNILTKLGIVHSEIELKRTPVICKQSKWLRTQAGGLLETRFHLCQRIEKDQLLAEISDPYGHLAAAYRAPFDGIVIGMSKSPLAVMGTRYCHLGVIGEPTPGRDGADELASEPGPAEVGQVEVADAIGAGGLHDGEGGGLSLGDQP